MPLTRWSKSQFKCNVCQEGAVCPSAENEQLKNDSFRDFVLEQLRSVRPLTCRAMFGGHGLRSGARFFGIIHKGRLYFKVNEATRSDYEAAGMGPFQPGKHQILRSFYEVPIDVLESPPQIEDWAIRALRAATDNPAPTKKSGAAAGTYTVQGSLWVYEGSGGWHFVTVPPKQSASIKKTAGFAQKAWGSLAVLAKIGSTEWRTSLFFDSKRNAYLLPVKSTIRKTERLITNKRIKVYLRLRCD